MGSVLRTMQRNCSHKFCENISRIYRFDGFVKEAVVVAVFWDGGNVIISWNYSTNILVLNLFSIEHENVDEFQRRFRTIFSSNLPSFELEFHYNQQRGTF